MFFIYLIYGLLLAIFVFITIFILRFNLKFGYLSPHFKYAIGVFFALSALLIITSLYLLVHINTSGGSGGIIQQGGLNF